MGVDIQTYRAKIGTYRHSNGVDVVTLVLVVNFNHGIKTIGSVLFIGLLLVMAGIEQNPGPREHELASQTEEMVDSTDKAAAELEHITEAETRAPIEYIKPTRIKVSGLAEHFNQGILEMFFKSQEKHGGGKVKSVEVDSKDKSAIIEFEEATAIEFIMDRLPLTILGMDVNVEVLDTTSPTEQIKPTKIKVSGLSEHINQGILEMFFKSEEEHGGGKVKSVEVDSKDKSAVIEFEEATAVEFVMDRLPLTILGMEVNVEVIDPRSTADHIKATKIKVSGLSEHIRQEILEMFFKGEEKHGGGKVKSVEVDSKNKSAVIEFEEAAGVKFIIDRLPLIILGMEVNVEIIDQRSTTDHIEATTIKVSGLSEHIKQEDLEMFFNGEEKHGGGKVKSVEVDSKNKSAIIEFEEAAGVKFIMDRLPLIILGIEVHVEVIDPRSPTEQIKSTKIKVSGLSEHIKQEVLEMFFKGEEKHGGGKVKSVEVDSRDKSAIIEFEEAAAVELVMDRLPMTILGMEVNVEVIDPASTMDQIKGTKIKVSGLSEHIKQEVLEMFFKGEEKHGGGKVKSVEIDSKEHSAIIEFEEAAAVEFILDRLPLTILGTELNVEVFAQDSSSILLDENKENQPDVKQSTEGEIQESGVMQETAQDSSSPLRDENKETRPAIKQSTECQIQEPGAMQETDCEKFKQVLEKLGLAEKYPGKISIKDVIAIDPEEANDQEKQLLVSEIPWVMLKRLISAHSDARDIATTNDNNTGNETDFDSTLSFLSDVPDESENLSPIDICAVVFQCCDPLLKQIFFQKFYLCKMAVPFLYQSWATQVQRPVISVWPLRYLAIENKTISAGEQVSSKEVDILELSSKVLAFARLGRPHYSKSKLLNSLLSSHGCKTFFNIDCPSGMTPRYISNGQIEMFWLPTIGDKKDKFQDAVTFLNMRGDLKKNFATGVCDFMAKFIDAVALVTDLHYIRQEANMLKHYVLQFPSVILIIANPVIKEDIVIIQDFERNVKVSRNDINLRVLSTHKGTIEQNVVDMVSSLSKHIVSQLKAATCRSIQQRLSEAFSGCKSVTTDEENNDCEYGKIEAEKLLDQMKKDGEPRSWKQVLTPVHSKYSRELGQLKKKREREKDLTKGENIETEMKVIRKLQTKSITTTVKCFVKILTDNSDSFLKLKLVLGWLHFFIEREKRGILPQLMHDNRCAWERLKTLKSSKETTKADDIKKQENQITQLENKIDDASFSVEHFFREVGHIYEAFLELDIKASDAGLPEINKIAYVVGRLVSDGHQLELIDGESFYMPFRWTRKVLHHVDSIIGSAKIMTLSVLGLQSSGKSTLLNTMFGSQFSTRTGRCTRGIHIQLVPAETKKLTSIKSSFSYVLVVDTEGLRSPELSHIQHEHDNELATVITGLGDITMLNVMGENIGEIRDILQVIVHAFLRLKMTNRNLDIRKSCTFIHQNVTDTSASENMISGLSKLMQTLDAMTEESARSEGILDITTFNQVIEFDINSQVWYLKNLWQGNPPMARVNTEYSERVVDMKCKIIRKALNVENKSYKSLPDILEQAYSLWKGVLNENFVFSFRNSIEIRAYMDMEMVVQDNLWQLESFIRERLIDKSQSRFSDCDQKDKLRAIADEVIRDLKYLLSDEKIRTEKALSIYFERNKFKDIIIQWKNTQQARVDILCQKLERTVTEQIEKNYMKRSVEILTVSSHEKHEEELRKKSMEVANKYKGKQLSQAQKDKLFAEIWKSFINKIDTYGCSTDTMKKIMKTIFIDCLHNIFEKHRPVLKTYLQASSHLMPLQGMDKLADSFGKSGIDDRDVSLSLFQKGTDFVGITDAMAHVTTRVNQIFANFDEKIKQICQVNEEITEMHVNKLLHDLQNSIHDKSTEKGKYDFKPTFKVKIFVHISRYAYPKFEQHNEDYFKTQGVAVRLEQYRQQQKISFEAHLNNRASEDIVAQLFSNVIEGFAKEWTLKNISNKVTDELHSFLPSVKNRVIIEICSGLLADESFDDFLRYLLSPKDYASHWINERAYSRLFDKDSKSYVKIAVKLVNGVFGKAEDILGKLKEIFGSKSSPSIDEWVNEFIFLSKDVQLSIPVESFRNVRTEGTIIKNVEYLTDVILANMMKSKDEVVTEFKSHTRYSVQWSDFNPIKRITEKIWGCPEQCPFCGEPCAKNEDHKGDEHFSIQHRPKCCNGVHQTKTEKASLEACSVDVKSEREHKCNVFRFACNKEKQKPCGDERHPYKEYKTFYPQWDIPPQSNMTESSKFWMWFVATYQTKLCNTFSYKLDHLPASWKEITKDQATESLRNTYSVK